MTLYIDGEAYVQPFDDVFVRMETNVLKRENTRLLEKVNELQRRLAEIAQGRATSP